MSNIEKAMAHLRVIYAYTAFARKRGTGFLGLKAICDIEERANDALALLKEDCHNCKLECLLQKYDELKEKYDKLLKEQESTTFNPHYIDEYGTHFICGVECGSCHEKISRTYHYCPYCGKAVEWE